MPSGTNEKRIAGPRLIAIVGPFQSGKTTLLESILARTGTIAREGSVASGTAVGDSSPEARAHAMSVEANVASCEYLGDRYTFVDCPGSVEFLQDMRQTIPVCDAAIVVCEADERKVPALQVILRELEDRNIPRFLFLNKIDIATQRLRDTLALLQPASRTPLLMRQIPIWQNGVATGFIDLALERAFVYREHAPSVVVDVPAGELPREKESRYSMLEKLADHDDALMEELLSDIEPPKDQVFDDLAKELQDGYVAPVLIGSADRGNGVTRLLKALRHEAPGVAATRARLGVSDEGATLAQVFRTVHTTHGGKMSLSRVLRGSFADGAHVLGSKGGEGRISGVSRLMGGAVTKQSQAAEGDTLAFGRLDAIATGEALSDGKSAPHPVVEVASTEPVYAFALKVKDRKDEARVGAALAKLTEEDPSLIFRHDQGTGELKIVGQGEMHLRVALEKLAARFGVQVEAVRPHVGYKETIRDQVAVRGRHKKQSGGHGQFGDVALTVRPRQRGEGFAFSESVHGGTVPRQYFSAIEAGAEDSLARGPLGFPVVDVGVELTDGSYHTVDSSDMAFRTATKIGMQEALEKARPILLEPILAVDISIPSDHLSRATGLVTARRGQILGYDARPGWGGWEILQAQIPESEVGDLIIELRSATAGVGSYTAKFDHLAELTGRGADQAIAARKHELHPDQA
jgi:elongation factor G